MTKLAFKGIHRPTQPDHVGLLCRFYYGDLCLMLWNYQKHNVIEEGWLVFRLQQDLKPEYYVHRYQDEEGNHCHQYIEDVHLEVIGIASSLPVVDPKPQRPVIRFIRTARKEI